MTPQLEARLYELEADFNFRLDRIRDEVLANLARLTRQVGQWTRIDKSRGIGKASR